MEEKEGKKKKHAQNRIREGKLSHFNLFYLGSCLNTGSQLVKNNYSCSWKTDVWKKRFLLEIFVFWFHHVPSQISVGGVQFHLRREAKK